MSFFYGDAQIPTNFTAAGGVAGLGAIYDAVGKQTDLTDNTNAAYSALYQAYDDRIAAIRQATGQAVENPLKLAEQDDFDKMHAPRLPMYKQPLIPEELQIGPRAPTNSQKQALQFSNWLAQMQQQFPDAADRIRANVPIERDAEAIAKAAEEESARKFDSSSNPLKWAAAFAGAFRASLNDPIQVATLFIGGGAGVGRNVALRIANVALKEALINGAVEASLQPSVQAWREKAGLPNGWKEGVVNTLFAATAGGLFGAAGEAAGAAAKRIFKGKELDAVVAEVRKTAPLTPDILKALDGDVDAAIKAISPIREALPAEARAAIDQHQVSQGIRQQIAQPTDMHDRNLDAASAVVLDPARETFTPEVDQAKVDRVAALLVPEAAPTRKAERDSLQGFLARAGGIQDQKGEVSALGLQNATPQLTNKKGLTYTKRLVRDNGMVLDQARKVAAEAGYFNYKYGSIDVAMEKATIPDLLDELENESRRVYEADPDESGRRYAQRQVNDLLQIIGPDVDDALVARAIQRAERDGIDPVEAFDIEARGEAAQPITVPERSPDPFDFPGDRSEPDMPTDDDMLTAADLEDFDPMMEIPFFDDGRTVTASQMLDDIDEMDRLFQATEVCRL